MDNKDLENKAITPKKKGRKPKENKAESNEFVVIESFCGIPKGKELTIKDPQRAKHMLNKGYVKIKD